MRRQSFATKIDWRCKEEARPDMKKILLANKFFYPRGGDCVHTLNLMQLLQSKGHQVAVFSMHYPENLPSEWQSYFADEVRFSGGDRLKALERIFGGAGVRARFEKLLDDFQPDIVHLHNIHSYLSPVLAEIAAKRGIPVFWTLHDYKLLCPAYSCLCGGKTCERCFAHSKMPVLTSRCMKGSLLASALAYLEALYWNRTKLEGWVNTFVCPSKFMASKMEQGGFAAEKLKVLCNFISSSYSESLPLSPEGEAEREEAYCYVGRLSAEKGVETLLKAASQLPYKLYVAGDGPLAGSLREKYGHCSQIVWLGRITPDEVRTLLGRVRFSVMPSECYDNNPISVIESLCMGTPLLGARIGGIPELIDEGVTGMTFESGNEEELKAKIHTMFTPSVTFARRDRMRAEALERFSPENYYERLNELYNGKQ